MTLTSDRSQGTKEFIESKMTEYRNPFKEAGLWIRGEMLDIVGMINSFKAFDEVCNDLKINEKEKVSES